MLPGKKYKLEDFVRILRRRVWVILVPVAVVAATTAVVVRRIPNQYRSETLILVVPQRVPESYVKSTVTTRIEDRLQSISQQILSRTRLERIIQDFNLYSDERKSQIMEDIVERMRTKEISVQIVKGDAINVSYIGKDPRTVMKVTERLASLFIEENLRDRAVLAEGTDQFLESQLEDARRGLVEHEKKLEQYRKQYSGELPEQLPSNLQAVHNIQLQIQTLVESMNRDRDQRLVVERQLADASADAAQAAAAPSSDVQSPGPDGTGTTQQQLKAARATLHMLELRYKPDHPDIGLWKRRIRDLEQKTNAEALAAPVSAVPAPLSGVEAARERRVGDLKAQMEQLDRQIAFKQSEEKRLRGLVADYQHRIDAVPTRESEMAELTRDYTTMQSTYTNLLTKKEESKIAANLERRQIGEQFRLIDPAQLPQKPFSPNRLQFNLFGFFGGLAISLGLVAFLEYRDSTFKTDEEVTGVLALPVLAVVPLMQSESERRSRVRRRYLMGLGLGSTVAACFAVVVYTLVR